VAWRRGQPRVSVAALGGKLRLDDVLSRMLRKVLRSVLGAIFLLAADPVLARTVPETIVVRLRFSYIICAGYCPNVEVWVSPSGQVASRGLFLGSGAYWWRPSRKNVEAFRRILATVKPTDDQQLDEACRPSDSHDDPRPNDLAVYWIDGDSDVSLTSCANTHMLIRSTVERALRALGVDLLSGDKDRTNRRR
jgi:hypothetical protein